MREIAPFFPAEKSEHSVFAQSLRSKYLTLFEERVMKSKTILVAVVVLLSVINIASATPVRGIDIDFVTIGNPGNPGDTRISYPDEANPYGCGAVGYEYQIGKYEITNAQWNAFTLASGAPTGNPSTGYDENATHTGAQQPTNEVSWYEAAQFCNYLTTGDKSFGVYHFSGNNTNPGDFLGVNRGLAISTYGTVYVIPTEDEWYKAAYYTGDGYSTYANGLDIISAADDGWNYFGGTYNLPWDVGTGTEEQNGTFDIMGNVWEWNETLIDSWRGVRGGPYFMGSYDMSSTARGRTILDNEGYGIGFRVASVPEPATLLLLSLGAVMAKKRKH